MSSPEHINESYGIDPVTPSAANDVDESDMYLQLEEGENTTHTIGEEDAGSNGPGGRQYDPREEVPEIGEGAQPHPVITFGSAEDALQTLIALATRPLEDPAPFVGDPMHDLLDKLGVKERPRRVGEHRSPPSDPHPSSTLLLLKRRLHEEFRSKKSDRHAAHCDALDELERAHKEAMQAMLNRHGEELLACSTRELEMAPLPAAPTAKSIHALQRQIGGDTTHQMDAATRRLSTLWKTKYERNCSELIEVNETLMTIRSEFEQLHTLDGRDAGYLETKLGILRDDLEAERAKGDSLKQAFLLECRNNGISPEGYKETTHRHLGRRQLQAQFGVGDDDGGEDPQGGDPAAPPLMINGEFLLDKEQVGEGTFSFAPDGCRLPSIREMGLRIAELEREVAIQAGVSDRLLLNVQGLEVSLDEAQMAYSRRAGAVAANSQLPLVEALILNKTTLEADRSDRYEGHFMAMRHTIATLEKELAHAKEMGSTAVALVQLEAEAKREMRLLDIAHARETMIQRVSTNAGEASKVDYYNARLHTLACEKRLLDHELVEAKEKAVKSNAALESQFAALSSPTTHH